MRVLEVLAALAALLAVAAGLRASLRPALGARRGGSSGSSGSGSGSRLWEQPENQSAPEKCGPCKFSPLCSGEYADKGCDGTGRISGGMGAVLPWFPIKVYRPCPSYLAAGYQYKREGQTVDQVLFSEPSDKMKEKMRQMKANGALTEVEAPKPKTLDGSNANEVDKILRDKFGNQ